MAAARETGAIFTIEEHSVLGGLGSAVAEVLAESDGAKVPFKRLGVPSGFSPHIGSQDYMQECHGLTEAGIAKSVASVMRTVTSG
jgi:transketolase